MSSLKLDAVRSRLIDSREKPSGELRVTTTLGLGANWLAPRLGEFVELYPEVKLQLLLSDDDLDLGMREADVALRLREPMQPDLIRRRLFTVHFHAYASADYLKKRGQPRTVDDLDHHRLVAFGAPTATHFLYDLNSLLTVGRDPKNPRTPHISINNLGAIIRAVEHGVGIAVLPDYCVQPEFRAGASAAAGRYAGDGLFPGLCRGDEERRARAGFSRLPGQRGATMEILGGLAARCDRLELHGPVTKPEYRGTASGFAYMFVKLPSFLAIFLFPSVFATIGKANATLLISIFPLIGLLSAIFILPEVYGFEHDAGPEPAPQRA